MTHTTDFDLDLFDSMDDALSDAITSAEDYGKARERTLAVSAAEAHRQGVDVDADNRPTGSAGLSDDILAVLAEDPDSPSSDIREGREVAGLDVNEDLAESGYHHGIYNVRQLARWSDGSHRAHRTADQLGRMLNTGRTTVWQDSPQGNTFAVVMDDDIRPTDRKLSGRFDAGKLVASEQAREARLDREAFPYLFDVKGRRTRLDGRQASANMDKVRARMAS